MRATSRNPDENIIATRVDSHIISHKTVLAAGSSSATTDYCLLYEIRYFSLHIALLKKYERHNPNLLVPHLIKYI
jgi:hypothetical protein